MDWFTKVNWGKIKTVGEVLDNLKTDQGISHCIQVRDRDWTKMTVNLNKAGIDRANQQAANPGEWIDQWEVKTTCLSFQNGEVVTSTGEVDKGLVLSRYQSQIDQIFNK